VTTAGHSRHHDRLEAEITMQQLRQRLSDEVVDDVLSLPHVRPEVVARARALLDGARWCRSEEVASELVDCFVGRRVP
jgi:hypothetical protein